MLIRKLLISACTVLICAGVAVADEVPEGVVTNGPFGDGVVECIEVYGPWSFGLCLDGDAERSEDLATRRSDSPSLPPI